MEMQDPSIIAAGSGNAGEPRYIAVRYCIRVLSVFIALAGIAWGSGFFRFVGWDFLPEQLLAMVLGAALALVFLTYPLNRNQPGREPGIIDYALAIISFSAAVYLGFQYPQIVTRFFDAPMDGLVISWILFAAVIEGLRRTSGWTLVIVVGVFFLYSLVGHLVEGDLQSRQVEVNQMVLYLGVDTSGLFGLVLLVGVTIVIPFVFFGLLLSASGGAQFFNDISLALMGRYRGGSAKISVLASSLFGSINGIVVSNILATGVITIPLMKKSGYTPEEAAAIEASSSNGGQLMPPVMGATAFLMADFLQISYAEVAIAALVPSLLYYFSLFVQVDLIAGRRGISGVAKHDLPKALNVIARGWLFLTPFAILIYALFWLNREPENAAMMACVAVMLLGFVTGYAGERLTLAKIWDCVVWTGRSSADIILIAAAAGFVMGILQITGLGFALTMFLVKIGAGNLLLMLFISAVLCIVLGMGMPTLGVYVLLAILVVPSLVEVGITPMAAHMFILYLGMMSFVTPPIAIAAYFAANLAKADAMKTGWVAMRSSWTAYVIPFLFIFSPALLLQESSVIITVATIVSVAFGVLFVSVAMIGYGLGEIDLFSRFLALAGGILLLLPIELDQFSFWSHILGVAAVGIVAFLQLQVRLRDLRQDQVAAK